MSLTMLPLHAMWGILLLSTPSYHVQCYNIHSCPDMGDLQDAIFHLLLHSCTQITTSTGHVTRNKVPLVVHYGVCTLRWSKVRSLIWFKSAYVLLFGSMELIHGHGGGLEVTNPVLASFSATATKLTSVMYLSECNRGINILLFLLHTKEWLRLPLTLSHITD